MKAGELRELPLEELQQKHDDWQHEYFGMRVKHALGQLENPLVLRGIRRDIARARTLLREQGIKEVTRKRRQTTAKKPATPKKRKKKASSEKAASKATGSKKGAARKKSAPKKKAAAKKPGKKSKAGTTT